MDAKDWRHWQNSKCIALWLCAIITVVLACGCRATADATDALKSLTGASGNEKAEEGPLRASGTIRAEERRIASELGGRIIEVRADVGAHVQSGDVLIVLDTTPLLAKLAEAEAAVTAAEADLAIAKAGPRVEEIAAAKAAVTLAEAQRDGALAAWENALEAIENPQEIDAQIAETRTELALAEQGVELAEAELAQEQLLRDQRSEGSVERQIADFQVRAAENALAASRADENTARTLLNWLWVIRNEPLGLIAQAHLAEGKYQLAEASVAVAQAQLDDLLAGPTPEAIAVAEAAASLARAQAGVLLTQQTKSLLTSPVDGVVLDQALRAGEVAAPAATILTVADLQELTLDVFVPENRIGHVQLGQLVQVTVDSFPDKAFVGQVMRIGDEPEFTPRNVATQEERINTFFAVEVRLDNKDGLLKPGMPADATFQQQ